MKKLQVILAVFGLMLLTTGEVHAMGIQKKIMDHNTLLFSGSCNKDVQIYLYDKSGNVVYNSGAQCKNGTFSFNDQIDKWNLPDSTYKAIVFETGDTPNKTKGDDFTLDRKEIANPAQTTSPSLTNTSEASETASNTVETSTPQGTVSGNLRVKGDGLFEGILSVIDTLLTKNVVVSGIAQFFGDVFFKGNVFFASTPTFNSDTAGFAVIKTGATKVSVTFDKPYSVTPIVNVTIKADGDGSAILAAGYLYIVSDQTANGFTIVLNKPAVEDITFSWTSLAVSNVKTSQSQ